MMIDTDGSGTTVTVPSTVRGQTTSCSAAILDAVNEGPDELAIDRRAPIERTDLPPNSWVEIVPRFVRQADAVFDELHESLPWQQTEVLRYDRYVPERRLGAGVRSDSHALFSQ